VADITDATVVKSYSISATYKFKKSLIFSSEVGNDIPNAFGIPEISLLK
jgi:hypothetical protein